MSSLKNETIKKIFGANIQGGMGLALTLLERASTVNWETLWPQFQKAMIGLGVAAIATIQGEAIRKGLSELAERIASFQPTVSPMPGEPLTRAEAMPIPYIPAPSIPYPPESITIKHAEIGHVSDALNQINSLQDKLSSIPPSGPDRCKELLMLAESINNAIYYLESIPTAEGAIQNLFWHAEGVVENMRMRVDEMIRREGCAG